MLGYNEKIGRNSMEHSQLIEEAKAAIERVFSDTSVSKRETVDSLEELINDMESRIECLEDELEKEEEDSG
jgi:polyhydroxyalkanoate synthesis regulator phasin